MSLSSGRQSKYGPDAFELFFELVFDCRLSFAYRLGITLSLPLSADHPGSGCANDLPFLFRLSFPLLFVVLFVALSVVVLVVLSLNINREINLENDPTLFVRKHVIYLLYCRGQNLII